jgi:outer membrane biosynthesis protein TonB
MNPFRSRISPVLVLLAGFGAWGASPQSVDAAPAVAPDANPAAAAESAPATAPEGDVGQPDSAVGEPAGPPPGEPQPLPPPDPESAVEAPVQSQPPAAVKSAPAPKPVVASSPTPEVAAPEKKVDECREGVSDLVPKKEIDLACPTPVDASRMKYKPGTGLSISSADDRFALETRLRGQFLYTVENDAAANEVSQGLQIRRARLQFKGHMFNKHNKFKVEFAMSPRDQGFDGAPHQTPILDWYHDFTYLENLSFRVGQYKVPYSRQRVISSGDLELVDRALAQGEFNLDRDVGFDFRSKDFLGLGKLRYYAGMWMGEGRDYRSMDKFEFMYIGRVELLPFGMFEDYEEGDFERTKKPRLSLGAAYAFIDAAHRNRGILGDIPSDGGNTDTHNITGDFVFKILGVSASGEFYWRDGTRSFGDATEIDDMGVEVPAPRERARRGIGWYGQAGYMIPRIPLQVAARYSQTRRLEQDRSTLPEGDEVGGGLSYYFARHPMKLQLDYFHGWEDQQLARGTDRIRLQLQASF